MSGLAALLYARADLTRVVTFLQSRFDVVSRPYPHQPPFHWRAACYDEESRLRLVVLAGYSSQDEKWFYDVLAPKWFHDVLSVKRGSQ